MAKLKKIDLTSLFKEFERSRCVNDDGKIAFKGLHFDDISTAVGTFVEFSSELPTLVHKGIVTKAIFDAANKGKVTRQTFEASLKTKEREYLRKKNRTFYYLSSISLIRPPGLSSVTINGQKIFLAPSYPRRFTRNGLDIDSLLLEQEKNTRSFTKVRIKVDSRCQFSAYDKAQNSIDLLRAIWNLFLNPSWRTSYCVHGPVNTLVLGPVHTIHIENGNPAGKVYWFENDYPKRITSKNVHKKFAALRDYEKKIMSCLNRSKYRQSLIDILVRYCRALDLNDFEASFLKVWSVIESLTNTVGARYDDTIRRCSFLFKEGNYHKAILEHLRYNRNASVHSNEFTDDSEKVLYQLKFYAEHLLRFHLGNKYRFSSMFEAGDFLASSTDINSLISRLNQTKYALRFLRYYD